jgi:hypothetical protein
MNRVYDYLKKLHLKIEKMSLLRLTLEKIALWIKRHTHPFRVFGGIFLCLAFIAGLFWIGGSNIEPVAFTFGIISSLLFASPSAAEYILPDRKPIREMTFDEILKFIITTDPIDDWHGISRDFASERFLKEDPRLRFRAKFGEDGIQCRDFKDDWANCYPRKEATGFWYDLYYDGAFLDRIILVAVNDACAMIPPPDSRIGQITVYNYRVAQIHDTHRSLDEHLKRSNLHVGT